MDNLWKKSILIEVVNKRTSMVVDAFTLAIPPTSYSFQQGQRLVRKKTFAGVWEDDYGLDNATITITGESGNMELKTIYRGGLPNMYLDGMDAVYYLRDHIIQYKKRYNNFEQYELILYDLSSLAEWQLWGPMGVSTTKADAFKVSLEGQSKIDRSSNKPKWASYTLTFFVLKQLGDYESPRINFLRDFEWLRNMVRSIDTLLGMIKNALNWAEDTLEAISEAVEQVNRLKVSVYGFLSQAEGVIDEATATYQQIFDIAQFPSDRAASTMESVESASQIASQEIKETPEKVEATGEGYEQVFEEITITLNKMRKIASAIKSFGKSNESKMNIPAQIPEGSSNSSTEDTQDVADLAKATGQQAPTEVPPSTTQTVMIYGDMPIIVTKGDTLESLADQYLGEASMASFIARYTGKSNYDLEVGDTINIPMTRPMPRLTDNQVFGFGGMDMFYGRDIKIGAGKEFMVASSGDYVTVGGPDNLVQSLTLRLNEVVGARLRLTSYGIKVEVGRTMGDGAPVGYIVSSIKDTLMQDPRVRDIFNIRLNGQGDTLYVSFTVLTVTGDQFEYSGAA